MPSQEQIVTAQRLRDEGLLLREIAEEMGLGGVKQAWKCVNPERDREHNLARHDKKRAWEKEHASDCPSCGVRLSRPGVTLCDECERDRKEDEARERTERFIALRAEGLLNTQIAARESVTRHVVASVLSRAHRYGLEVPPSPYWSKASR